MSDISDRVTNIVVEHLGVDADKVVEGASFIDDLGADSLDTVELVMAFEEEFGVEIPDDAAERILTVKDAVAFLEENAGELLRLTVAGHGYYGSVAQPIIDQHKCPGVSHCVE